MQRGEGGVHLIDWDTLCKPKELGGAGLKSARDMNCALMVKLAWKLLNQSGQAWRKVLSSKYVIEVDDGVHFKSKTSSSQVWRGILQGSGLLDKDYDGMCGMEEAYHFGKMFGLMTKLRVMLLWALLVRRI